MAGLAAYVHVEDEHGHAHVFGPGDDVPKWAEKRITNPKAWEGEAPAKAVDFDPNTPPPRAGKGSGREAWVTFAQATGYDVAEDQTRDDIIRSLEERGVVTPEE